MDFKEMQKRYSDGEDSLDCPLFRICERGKSEDFSKVMRIMQSYTIAGDILPKDFILGVVENFIEELKKCKSDASGKAC